MAMVKARGWWEYVESAANLADLPSREPPTAWGPLRALLHDPEICELSVPSLHGCLSGAPLRELRSSLA